MNRIVQVIDVGCMPYETAWMLQKQIVAAKRQRPFPDILLLAEHPPVYTIGRRGGEQHLLLSKELLAERGIPIFNVERGGDITFHGLGQLVGYPILNLKYFRTDVHWYLRQLEEVIMATLRQFHMDAKRWPGLTGVWVGDAKVAAIGISVHGWITMHGFALNISTDLTHFDDIVPCGIRGKRVGAMASCLGKPIQRQAVAETLINAFGAVFETEIQVSSARELDMALEFASPADHCANV
ncbi:MAG: lipoyl(octanoyl) transferase LipB [Acidobacteria bacterium]|nr:lipoyl(octanoyl) transferase LipB [Acidobacteriota bacterium]MBI3655325.1 lipoyl(octanoyl) transferase LipB [Acidobacteriota bacterium]